MLFLTKLAGTDELLLEIKEEPNNIPILSVMDCNSSLAIVPFSCRMQYRI